MYTGPNIIRDGLVLYLDSDNIKSYPGEPTTNEANTDAARTIGLHNSGGYGNAGTIEDAPERGLNWKKITITNRGTNYRIAQFPYINQTTTKTYSIEFDLGNTSGYFFGVDGSGGYTCDINNNIAYKTVIVNGTYAIFLNNFTTGLSGITDIIYYRYYQVETKPYATPFVNVTRGTTVATGGGWKDLSNNSNNGDLTGMTYNISGMTFNGTTSKIITSRTFSSANTIDRTWEIFVKPGTNSAAIVPGLFGHATSAGCSYFCNGGIMLNGGKYCFNWYDNVSYQFLDSTITATAGQYSHVVATWNSSDLKPRIYVNGILKATYGAASNINYGTNANLEIIGYSNATAVYFNGVIDIVKFYYNKCLIDSEVLQNYNALHQRFGL